MEEKAVKFLHLDLKGIVPGIDRFRKYLQYFASLGYSGIVLECDCRIPWKCWEGAGEILFTKEEISSLAEYAESLNMEIVPLIQCMGHMEWVLKEEKYSHLRENGYYNDLCPSHPETVEKLKEWIDETFALFPRAKRLHLGGDEAWHLGSCPVCQAKITSDPLHRGKMGLFTDHISLLANYAKEKYSLQVMLWDDMFCKEENKLLLDEELKKLPADTIFVHWKYQTDAEESLAETAACNRIVWGASALRCSWQNHFVHALNFVHERFANISCWEKTGLPILHTTWGRPNNLWNPYGPWEALIPEFIAGGKGVKEVEKHPWKDFLVLMDEAVKACDYKKLENCLAEGEKLSCSDEWEEEGKAFFLLGLRYEILRLETKGHLELLRIRAVLEKYGRGDPAGCEKDYASCREEVRLKIEKWEKDLEEFWKRNSLSDFEEYRDLRRAEFFIAELFERKTDDKE